MKPLQQDIRNHQWNLVYRWSKKMIPAAIRWNVRGFFKWRLEPVDVLRSIISDEVKAGEQTLAKNKEP